MANRCMNTLEMKDLVPRGFVKDIFSGKPVFSLNDIIPEPDVLPDEYSDITDWRWKNWGTDREPCDVKVYGSDSIDFDTAWRPPVPVLQKISEMYS